jgi:microcystin-dependent protein
MPEYTSRLALPYPDSDNSESPAGPAQIEALAAALDGAAVYSQGILADQPVSSAASPGIAGRFYYVIGDSTASNNGIMWLDYGTGWVQVNAAGTVIDVLANRPAASAVPAGGRYFANDQIAEYLSNGTSWTRLGDQPGEVTLCLSATADPGHILLQGQVWPSTSGIYADLYAKLGGSNLPDAGGLVPVGFKTSDTDFGTLLGAGGEKKHTLTTSEMPAHTHSLPVTTGDSQTPNFNPNTTPEVGTGVSGSAGGGLSHNNLQPFLVVNFQAKL